MHVIPAQAGIQQWTNRWIPVFTGMTCYEYLSSHDFCSLRPRDGERVLSPTFSKSFAFFYSIFGILICLEFGIFE
jgi:hypothetical protein